MKIFDCFTIFNDLELLDLRLMTLYNVVDYFVLVEGRIAHSGSEKELYYDNNKNNFTKYSDKIIHIILDKLPHIGKCTREQAFQNEYYSRNAVSMGLTNANDDDYIMMSDIDEIPNPTAVQEGINKNFNIFMLKQKLFYYYVNNLRNQQWYGTVVCRKKHMQTPQGLRDKRGPNINVIDNGGWHYSFLGGKDRIKLKMASFSETQTNIEQYTNDEHLLKCLETGADMCNRQGDIFKNRFISLEEVGHKELSEWILKYPNMIKL